MIEDRHPPDGPLRIARKDAGLIREAASQQGLSLPICEAVEGLLRAAESAGQGDSDMSAIRRALA